MLSIGTAGAGAARKARDADRSGARWAPDVASFMIAVQERTAAAQAGRLLGNRYLRVNHVPTRRHAAFENMDVASDETRKLLLEARRIAAQAAYRNHRAFVDRMLSDKRR